MRKVLRVAFVKSLPVMAGYLSIGIAFGLLMQEMGYNVVWALLISLVLYAGSMQFVLLQFLSGGASLLTVAVTTLLVNSRHLFYGLSFIDTFRSMGKKYLYMIHSLTDETYSLLCSYQPQEGEDGKQVMFWMSLLDHIYWLVGTALGALVGGLIPFDTTGIDFAMTALFVVIFVEQWKGAKSHLPAMAGLICGVLSLLIFGADRFILPAMILGIAILLGSKKYVIRKEMQAEEEKAC